MKTKDRILNTASTLFHKQGYNSTGVNQIIQEAGVAKASFYSHFVSKEKLAARYLEKRHKFWMLELNDSITHHSDTKNKVLSVFYKLKELLSNENFNGCTFLNMLSEIKQNKNLLFTIIKKHKKEQLNFFKTLISNEEKAFLTYMLFEASLTETQINQNNDAIDKAIEILKNQL